MKVKKAVVWWLVTEVEPPVLAIEDKKIESLMPLVEALFPGISYCSTTGFNVVMHACVMPALKKLFPEFQAGPAGSIVTSEEEVEIEQFLPSQGFEWQDSKDWQLQFIDLLAASGREAMGSNFLVSTTTLRKVIEQSVVTQEFREAFTAWLTEHGAFVNNTIPLIELGMLIGEMVADNCIQVGDDMNTVLNDIRDLDKLPYVSLFHLGELITIAGGRTLEEAPFVASEGMVGLRDLISYMTDGGMMTDSAVLILAPQCRTGLLEQHPWLSEINISDVKPEDCDHWLAEQVAKYGERHPVAALVNASDPAESVSDLHRRNAKRMNPGGRSVMKTAPIASTDVGKIFVVSVDGKTGRIMLRDEFFELPIDVYDCWEEIGEFDVNQ